MRTGTSTDRATATDRETTRRETVLQDAIRQVADALDSAGVTATARPDPRAVAATEFGTLMATAGIPAAYGAPGLRVDGHRFDLDTATERVVLAEEGCRVSLDAFMSAPGPSMAGVLIGALGDHDLRTRFYGRLLERPTWTFFAMTEPGVGTDATAMTTRAASVADGVEITGSKCFIGNAARAGIGVVFARTGSGPFAIDAFMTEPDRPGFRAEAMPTIGVPGAEFCSVELTEHPVPAGDLVGRQLPRSRRGIRGGMTVFHALRPAVAAMSLGLAVGALDELADHLGANAPAPQRDGLSELRTRALAVRRLIRRAAHASDAGDGAPASAAKEAAHRFARDTTRHVARTLGLAGLLDRPRALSAVANAWAVQFMEGTVDVQRLQVFQALNSASCAADRLTGQRDVSTASPGRGTLEVSDGTASGSRNCLLERPS